MFPSQLILSSIILFIVYKTIIAYKKGNFTKTFVVIWLLFWIVTLFLLLRQNFLIYLAHLLGIGRGVDLAIYVSIIVIFYLIFRIFVEINIINEKITKIVRHQTLENYKKKK